MDYCKRPRIVVAGISGDSGKTIVSCGLLAAIAERGIGATPFKKGPDYIDPAWLRLAAGKNARNLDTFLMDNEVVRRSFVSNSEPDSVAIIEGNRGLFDGFDSQGSHSTAELAKLLDAPVILAIAPRKVTRTVAAWILGCKELDKNLKIEGVVLTGVAGKRHAKVITEAVENYADSPVLGVIPRISDNDLLPSRHLGLITPEEFDKSQESLSTLRKTFEDNVDTDKIIEIAEKAPAMECTDRITETTARKKFTAGYFKDKSFSFYYPENLEALADEGAELRPVSSIDDPHLPADIDCFYIGGGFPETNLEALVANRSMMRSVRQAAENGLPTYAECGGLIYLSRVLFYKGRKYEMAGVFPAEIEMKAKPQGHGYSIMKADCPNPYFPEGREIKGHEFHYTTARQLNSTKTCFEVVRGSGAKDKRDGFISGNTFATYMHIHALGEKHWAGSFARKAVEYARNRQLI